MSKAVLISIHPEWCEKIINGQKTIEVRKTRPKLDTPFKCYIYECKRKLPLTYSQVIYPVLSVVGTGKVIGEFICDRIHKFKVLGDGFVQDWYLGDLYRSCLSPIEVGEYIGRGQYGYSWRISDLVIYEKPKELGQFKGRKLVWRGNNHIHAYETITRPPQSWRYVEEL